MNTVFKKMTRALAWVTAVTMSVWMVAPSAAAVTVYKYEWVSQSGTISADGLAHEYQGVTAGQTIPLTLNLLNRSGITIKGKSALPAGTLQVPVGVWGIGSQTPMQDGTPSFLDLSSFILNNNRFAYYDGADVPNGGQISFTWNIKMSTTLTNGTYKLYVRPVSEYLAWTRQVKNGYTLPSYNSDIFWQFVVGSGITTPATGGLTVALSGSTPASVSIADAANMNFTRFTLTAAAGTTVAVTQIWVTREGLSLDSDVENIQLLTADGLQVGSTAGGFDANHRAQVYINPSYSLTGSQDFYIRAGIVNGTVAGFTVKLGIAANSDIVSNATSVSGAPVWGNPMTTVLLAIGTLTIAEDGSVSDTTPDVGDIDVDNNTFKLTAGSTEAVTIERISAMKAGTAETSDTINMELWDVTHNVTLGTAATWSADGKVSWPVNMTLAKGDTVRLKIRSDIADGVSLTESSDVIDGSNTLVWGKGQLYGFYITPTISGSWTGAPDAHQTINSGALTISKSASTPGTGKITQADNQLLAVFDFDVKGESVRVSALSIDLAFADDFATGDVTNARLVDMATGNLLMGPVDGSADGSAVLNRELDFTSTHIFPVGVTKVGLKVRVAATAGDDGDSTDDTIAAAVTAAGDVTAKGLITNSTITAGGSYAVTANTQTIKAGALVVRTLGVPATGNVIVGATDYTWGSFSFDATASGEAVMITGVTITDTLDGTTGNMANIDNAELWADLDKNGSYETKLTSTDAPTGGGGASDTHAFTFTTTVTVPKGGSINWIFVGDLAAAATAAGTHALTVAADGATVTGADTGNAITDTASGTAGTLTVTAGGTMTTALAASTPTSALIVASTANYSGIGAFDFIASDEAYTIDTITFALTGWASVDKMKLTYPTKTGTGSREVSVSATAVAYSNMDIYVPKNGRSTVTVTATTKRIGTGGGGTFRDTLTLVLDTSATDGSEFNSIGEASGVVKDGSDVSDQTANSMYMYNTMPTVVASNPTGAGTIVPGGVQNLYKFKVTADAAGAVAIKKFTFQIFITDASTTTASTADLGGFTFLRNGVDLTASALITQVSTDGGATWLATPLTVETDDTNDLENNTSYWVQVAFGNDPTGDTEQLVGAGETVEYTLRATAGTGFTTTDAFSTTLLYDTTLPTASAFYLSDADTGTGVQQVIGLQLADATSDWADVEFIWSDRSVLIHVASFDDDGAVETSSADWTNGYLVNNFPVSAYGYTL